MKKLILIIALSAIVFACKKKKEDPTPTTQTPVCTPYPPAYAGKYYVAYDPMHHDTIEFVFLNNLCPNFPQQNNYNILKLGEAVQFNLKPGNTFDTNRIYGASANDFTKMFSIGMGASSFQMYNNDSLIDMKSYMFINTIHFKRFK